MDDEEKVKILVTFLNDITEKETVRDDLILPVQKILREVFNVKDENTIIIPSPRTVAEAIRKLGREDLLLYREYY